MNVMLKSAAVALLASLSLVPCAFSAETNEHRLQVSQLPAPVQTTLQRDGGQIQAVEKETEGSKTFYEATLKKGGKRYSLHIAEDGKILKREAPERETHKKTK